MPDPKLAAIKKHATETRKIKRRLRWDLLAMGILVVAVTIITGLAIAYDVREAAKCKARTCPGAQTPILIDVYCVCMTEATPP